MLFQRCCYGPVLVAVVTFVVDVITFVVVVAISDVVVDIVVVVIVVVDIKEQDSIPGDISTPPQSHYQS